MNTPPRPPRGCKYTIKLNILAAAVFRLRLHHRVDVFPDLALQENVVSHPEEGPARLALRYCPRKRRSRRPHPAVILF